jgi:SAM-dependent methyltransferase
VHEILTNLGPGQRVLDLGSNAGSFDSTLGPFITIRADLDHPSRPAPNLAQADAAHLPFPDRAFDAVISNHSLEHFHDLGGSLAEIGRVLKPTGALYIAVPDASTFCDRLYRWLARGGGHLNPFTSAPELAGVIERATRLSHVNTRTLCTSLSYLNRRNNPPCGPRRILVVGGGLEASLHLFTWFARLADRLFSTRLGVYGWALFFGNIPVPVETHAWTNVCVRCGSGMSSEFLDESNRVRRRFLIKVYGCPNCGTTNQFFEDRRYPHLETGSPIPNPQPRIPNPQPPVL